MTNATKTSVARSPPPSSRSRWPRPGRGARPGTRLERVPTVWAVCAAAACGAQPDGGSEGAFTTPWRALDALPSTRHRTRRLSPEDAAGATRAGRGTRLPRPSRRGAGGAPVAKDRELEPSAIGPAGGPACHGAAGRAAPSAQESPTGSPPGCGARRVNVRRAGVTEDSSGHHWSKLTAIPLGNRRSSAPGAEAPTAPRPDAPGAGASPPSGSNSSAWTRCGPRGPTRTSPARTGPRSHTATGCRPRGKDDLGEGAHGQPNDTSPPGAESFNTRSSGDRPSRVRRPGPPSRGLQRRPRVPAAPPAPNGLEVPDSPEFAQQPHKSRYFGFPVPITESLT
jgi:hypothetical protein